MRAKNIELKRIMEENKLEREEEVAEESGEENERESSGAQVHP